MAAALAAAALFSLLAACGRGSSAPPEPARLAPDPRLQTLLDERTVSRSGSSYRLAAGDQLMLTVVGVDDFSGQYRVSERGMITPPLVTPIPVAGKTIAEAKEEIRRALSRYVDEPFVSAAVADRRGSQVSVMGAVTSPGSYPLEGFNETLADVITRAGGLTARAGPALYFYPAEEGGLGQHEPTLVGDEPTEHAIPIDLTRLYRGRSVPELYVPLRPGDAVLVPLAGEFYVDGWAEQPGAYELRRDMTLTEGIAAAGGLHFGASGRWIKLVRSGEEGRQETSWIRFAEALADSSSDPHLQAGDRIEISANWFKASLWGVYEGVTSIVGVTGSKRVQTNQE